MDDTRNERIAALERQGLFDRDIEDDPPGREIKPDEIEYLKKGLWQRVKTRFAFFLAYRFAARAERSHRMIIKEVIGAEHLNVPGGVMLTANHFSPLDSFILHRTFDLSERRGKFYRIIREGNYTSFPGFYGFLMRNCNTLPLSANAATMRKFLRAVNTALTEGNCVLVYPEQSMWYNYRKPKPLKLGAYEMAVRADVPIVPCFITMEDTPYVDEGGEIVQAHTVHVGAPIYPDKSLPRHARAEAMMRENFAFNKRTYERFYGIALAYLQE